MSAESLSYWADVAAIITAVVALIASAKYLLERRLRRRRLEKYLKKERANGVDEGKRTVLHLVAQLGLTEADIVDASFRSNVIRRYVSRDDRGHASSLLLGYDESSRGNI